MSMRAGRRRRRRSRGGSSLAGDPLDLFLDAITNALGVIMFILLMVVLFGRATDAPAPEDRSAEAKRLEEEIMRLQREQAALPTPDSALERRERDASRRITEAERAIREAKARVAEVRLGGEQAARRVEELRKEAERLAAKVSESSKAARPAGGFVRISRLDTADARSAVLVGISGRRAAALQVAAGIRSVSAPTDGIEVTDPASASAAVTALLAGSDPKSTRVELIVWQGSFRESKLLEQALIDAGFAINAIPVEAGKALGAGVSGSQ